MFRVMALLQSVEQAHVQKHPVERCTATRPSELRGVVRYRAAWPRAIWVGLRLIQHLPIRPMITARLVL